MADVTAIILTKNEEKNIRACLESISGFVKRTVVVDSGSEDNTVETAKALGADVYENPFCYYAQQFNWGLNNTGIQTEWALRLDADERFTPELCETPCFRRRNGHQWNCDGGGSLFSGQAHEARTCQQTEDHAVPGRPRVHGGQEAGSPYGYHGRKISDRKEPFRAL